VFATIRGVNVFGQLQYGKEKGKMSTTIVVTRHKALVDFLIETGMVTAETPVLSHVNASEVTGKHVIGVLPMHLAALAATVTEIPLDIPAELRGKELDLEQVRNFAGDPVKYSVRKEIL
jgi:putative CRISPR-associated protein (TIGR02620 family)